MVKQARLNPGGPGAYQPLKAKDSPPLKSTQTQQKVNTTGRVTPKVTEKSHYAGRSSGLNPIQGLRSDSTLNGSAIKKALDSLGQLSAFLDQQSQSFQPTRPEKAKLQARLRQTIQSLKQLSSKAELQPAQVLALVATAQSLGAKGALFDFKGLLDSLKELLPPWGQAMVPSPPGEVEVQTLSERVEGLQQTIDQARQLFSAGEYGQIQQLLGNRDLGRSLGLSLNVQSCILRGDLSQISQQEIDSMVMQIRMSSMAWDSGKLDMVTVGAIDTSNGEFNLVEDDPALNEITKLTTPIMMEEWMHALQRAQGGPVSRLTEEYMKDNKVSWEGLHEMDIYAAFREWGFPVEELGTVHAYPERQDFENWFQNKYPGGLS